MHELADFAELLSWKQGSASATTVVRDLGRLAENEYSEGVPEEEEIPRDVEDAFREIERRIEASNGGYPFEFNANGTVLYPIQSTDDARYLAYKYMLLSTRIDMKKSKIHAGLDGTELLERLAAVAARQYLGERAESMIFGTSEDSPDFPAKINLLCHRLEEGGGFVERGANARRMKDDKLDVVAWTPFADRREAKLIAFGQCKTGTNWISQVTQLQPDKFCSKWFQSQPAVNPVRMFFISEALSSVDWRNQSVDAGLLFDRCRIIDYCVGLDGAILQSLGNWTTAAAKATGLPS
ncbi:MAG: hypothetical protein OXN21_04760 [Chloroflexota bacterium]|nr:hypothetical protein [Chloroflexota bacterium]